VMMDDIGLAEGIHQASTFLLCYVNSILQ
jgi:hypothetical protein